VTADRAHDSRIEYRISVARCHSRWATSNAGALGSYPQNRGSACRPLLFFNRMTSLCFSPQFPCSSRNPFGQGHSTPIKIQLNGRPQILLFSARVTNAERGSDQAPERSLELAKSGHGGVLSSSDPNTGELLWESYAPACSSPVAPPLRVFVTGGCRAGSVLLEITEVDGAFSVAEVFRHPPRVLGSPCRALGWARV